MTEDVTNTVTALSLNPEAMKDLFILRGDAIDAFVGQYTHCFDKMFANVIQSVTNDETKTKKFREIREKHIKDYEKYIETRLDHEMNRLFTEQTIGPKLAYISENFDSYPTGEIAVQTASKPVKEQFAKELEAFDQSLDQKLEAKTQMLNELTENLKKTNDSYEEIRTSVSKKALSIIKKVEAIEIHNLESLPNKD